MAVERELGDRGPMTDNNSRMFPTGCCCFDLETLNLMNWLFHTAREAVGLVLGVKGVSLAH